MTQATTVSLVGGPLDGQRMTMLYQPRLIDIGDSRYERVDDPDDSLRSLNIYVHAPQAIALTSSPPDKESTVNLAAKILLILMLATVPAGLFLGGAWWKWLITAAVLLIAAAVADQDPKPDTQNR